MRVLAERLVYDDGSSVDYRQTPNVNAGLHNPRLIVIHYTAGRSLESSVNWLRNPKAKASAHVVIGRGDGRVVQLAELDQVAHHAGASSYDWNDRAIAGRPSPTTLTRLNRHSIGIELDNPGPLQKTAAGWQTWYGERVKNDRVFIDGKGQGWHTFDELQLLACYGVCAAVVAHLPTIFDVVGHEDVAVPAGRKRDPGPAFPLERLRGWLFGRADDAA